jgi:hypothetical protein
MKSKDLTSFLSQTCVCVRATQLTLSIPWLITKKSLAVAFM